jgi:hypothetical protein
MVDARSFVTIKMDAHTELVIRQSNAYDTHDMARAAPFVGGFAGDFLRHLEEDFDDFPLGKEPICQEEDPALRKIHRFCSLFRKA